MTGRGGARKRQVNPELLSDEEYVLKRQRNNDAVNRTRQKKRQEETDTSMRVEELRNENTQLERKVEGLQKELDFLKEMFVAYAANNRKKGTGSEEGSSGAAECLRTSADVLDSMQKFLAYIKGDGNREVLERIRPIEQKLKPYAEKAMSASGTTETSKQMLRPRPDLMKVGDEETSERSEESEDEMKAQSSSVKKYVPPKVVALRYDENEEAKEERVLERARRKALQSSLISDLRAQYSEAPEEMQEEKGNRKVRQKDQEKQNLRIFKVIDVVTYELSLLELCLDGPLKYEEDYMIRLQTTKKERHERKLQNRQNILDELLHFGDYMAMDEGSKKDASHKKRKPHVKGGPKSKRRRDGGNRFEAVKRGGKKSQTLASGFHETPGWEELFDTLITIVDFIFRQKLLQQNSAHVSYAAASLGT
ncbi:Neuroguidin [Toxocara canis]|uniref:Neuroguidin n=1 Tax=Toxocara canis TaxID=6265 RepID=A0A0B2VR47_TOXCA|nr:Neuroguidin [Toxocara canis]